MSEARISLSLISHTNAGKTTLARTLLGRDVGEVRDAPHVTVDVNAYTLISTPEGDELTLWDTPGFGDSARLAKRLRQHGNPIGWFVGQVWDRFRDRSMWFTQQAVSNVRDQADVVLYLVNASEEPADAGYLEPEFAVLEWIGKPVVVLLNQTGRSRPAAEEAAEHERWRSLLAGYRVVRAVLPLDAFARCWVQEITLLQEVGKMLPAERGAAYARLVDAWQARREAQFEASMAVLAETLARAALDLEILPETRLTGTLRDLKRALGVGRDAHAGDAKDDKAHAVQALGARIDSDLQAGLDRLIAIHELEGHASEELLRRIALTVSIEAPVNERKAALMGGAVSGALTGLGVDIAHAGLTLGAGMLTGAVVGALGGAGIARGVNMARGRRGTTLRWDDSFLCELLVTSLLRYLAVAHYGRGRGEWRETEYPAFWPPLVSQAVAAAKAGLIATWSGREGGRESGVEASGLAPGRVATAVRPVIAEIARKLLAELYPATPD
ncbi:MAG: small GTP-binding protein domain protein [Candidatus Accumulibacter appositus]|uniref:Small GTP-binding protein domain protein n=1 Tax=Candidatus Accumulibacter appositus TaxID=1454003 RepID=A0A011N8Q7_9PROT|nr:DUF3482 domain-containing protein [Accumulibacter sp.]EXI78958.1 MAG: small GTP-binding protein domain protein [Candidatus Accumulibacter appositus]HRF05268.1 DUF3482 domain-containing protein [Accumulibacter sp.]